MPFRFIRFSFSFGKLVFSLFFRSCGGVLFSNLLLFGSQVKFGRLVGFHFHVIQSGFPCFRFAHTGSHQSFDFTFQICHKIPSFHFLVKWGTLPRPPWGGGLLRKREVNHLFINGLDKRTFRHKVVAQTGGALGAFAACESVHKGLDFCTAIPLVRSESGYDSLLDFRIFSLTDGGLGRGGSLLCKKLKFVVDEIHKGGICLNLLKSKQSVEVVLLSNLVSHSINSFLVLGIFLSLLCLYYTTFCGVCQEVFSTFFYFFSLWRKTQVSDNLFSRRLLTF